MPTVFFQFRGFSLSHPDLLEMQLDSSLDFWPQFREFFKDPNSLFWTPEFLLNFFLAVILAILLLYSIIKRKAQPKVLISKTEGSYPVFETTPPEQTLAIENIFPDEWFEKADLVLLKSFTQHSLDSTLLELQKALENLSPDKAPSDEFELIVADKLENALHKSLKDERLYKAFERKVPYSREEREIMAAHLKTLAPPVRLPAAPAASAWPRSVALAVGAAIGSILGSLALGTITFWLGFQRTIGGAFGGPVGAGLVVYCFLSLGGNEKKRRLLLGALGLALTTETLLAINPWGWLAAKGPSTSGRAKRFLAYLALAVVALTVKAKKSFSKEAWLEQIKPIALNWLAAVTSLAAVLSSQARFSDSIAPKESLNSLELLNETVCLVKKMRSKDLERDNVLLDQLVRLLSRSGYQMSQRDLAKDPLTITWSPSSSEFYEPFGLIRNGQEAIVEEEPIVKDGLVLKKGLATPR
ncbi:MAG: hypothetical protein LBV23_10775 [Deltaproteobacteria bacterium]|jgi:hypothetical protein|nr:hypothetical protein [Deltaproteobacteria bacterium]